MGFFKAEQLRGKVTLPTLPQCGRCGLWSKCQSPKMPPSGKGKHRIMFVGEAPGATEDRRGVQFVGDAGQCLRSLLDGLVELGDCVVTNSFICRPPSNKADDLFIEACRPNVYAAIKKYKPNVIVLLGSSAIKSVIGPEWGASLGEVSRWVGFAIPSQVHKAWLCPTYHPSYVMRNDHDKALKNIVRNHLRNAVRLENVEVPTFDVEERKKEIEIYEDPQYTYGALIRLLDTKGICAFDYETECVKPELPYELFSVSFHTQPDDGSSWTFSGRLSEPCLIPLSSVLRNPKLKKIGANIKFEERWTRRRLGHGVVNWVWDVVTSAHVADNREGITGLKFQTYVHTGVGDYAEKIAPFLKSPDKTGRNQIKKANLREVLTYGGLDSIFEYSIGMKQMERASWLK